jgi:hypothetical protein
MLVRNVATMAVAAGALLMPLTASSQQAPPQPPPEVQGWLLEMQQLQAELQPVQEQALQDEALQAEQTRLGEIVRDAMIAADPATADRLTRLEAIIEEAQQAQAAADTEKIAALTAEAQALQPQIAQAQEQALQQPEVEERIAAFQKNLQDRMVQIDPEARARIERLEELDRRIREAMGGTA